MAIPVPANAPSSVGQTMGNQSVYDYTPGQTIDPATLNRINAGLSAASQQNPWDPSRQTQMPSQASIQALAARTGGFPAQPAPQASPAQPAAQGWQPAQAQPQPQAAPPTAQGQVQGLPQPSGYMSQNLFNLRRMLGLQ